MIKFFKPPFTEEEIQKQFKELAKLKHPDKGGNENEFKELLKEKDLLLKFSRSQVAPVELKSKHKKIFRVKARPKKKVIIKKQVTFVFDFDGLVNLIKTVKKL